MEITELKKIRETETVKFEIAFLKSKKAYKSLVTTHTRAYGNLGAKEVRSACVRAKNSHT